MAKFKKGDSVNYRQPASYNPGHGTDQKESRETNKGECLKVTPNGVYVKNSHNQKEFIHRNRIDY